MLEPWRWLLSVLEEAEERFESHRERYDDGPCVCRGCDEMPAFTEAVLQTVSTRILAEVEAMGG